MENTQDVPSSRLDVTSVGMSARYLISTWTSVISKVRITHYNSFTVSSTMFVTARHVRLYSVQLSNVDIASNLSRSNITSKETFFLQLDERSSPVFYAFFVSEWNAKKLSAIRLHVFNRRVSFNDTFRRSTQLLINSWDLINNSVRILVWLWRPMSRTYVCPLNISILFRS